MPHTITPLAVMSIAEADDREAHIGFTDGVLSRTISGCLLMF